MGLGKRSNSRLDGLSGLKRTYKLSNYMKFNNLERTTKYNIYFLKHLCEHNIELHLLEQQCLIYLIIVEDLWYPFETK